MQCLQNGTRPRKASLKLVPRCSMLPGISLTVGFRSARGSMPGEPTMLTQTRQSLSFLSLHS